MLTEVPTNDSRARLGRWRTVLLFVVITLVAGEVAARVAEPLLPTPLRWPTAQIAEKADQMSQLAAQGAPIDVVFLGSSTVAQGIDPIAFNESSDGLTSYNAALDGASARSLERWAFDVVIPTLDPEMVVIGVTTRDLNDHGRLGAELLQTMNVADGWKDFAATHTFRRLIDGVLHSSALVRIKSVLRTPATTARQVTKGNEGLGTAMGPFGSYPARDATAPYHFETWRSLWMDSHLNDYTVGGEELAALDQLVARLLDEDIRVTLVEMPVHPDYLRVQPGGIEGVAAWREMVAGLASSRQVPFLGSSSRYGPSDFYDPAHLNQAAAQDFAGHLVESLSTDGSPAAASP